MTSNLVAITGNTYPVKEQLKAIGARWNADAKAWMVTADKADKAKQIVAGAGSTKPFRTFPIRNFRRRNQDDECELCGRNKYTCGHCIGW